MPISLGRIDPPASTADRDASPALLRQLHDDRVRVMRRGFLVRLPLLVPAAFLWMLAAADPKQFGMHVFTGLALAAVVGKRGYEWVVIRRADPVALREREERAAAVEKLEQIEHFERIAAVTPYVTFALAAAIVIVTIVEFASGPLSREAAAAALVKPAVRAGEWWRLLTASYLHGSVFHLVSNVGALVALGHFVETYDRRTRVPLVYLASAIGGNVLSTLVSSRPAVGASGGVLGLVGYLLVIAGREGGAPAWIRRRMIAIVASMALVGLAAYFFIDNAAHVGGVLTGALVGTLVTGGSDAHDGADVAGWIAAAILMAGAAFTIAKLI